MAALTMRKILVVLFLALFAGRLIAAEVSSREQIEKDLSLNVALTTPATIRAGEKVEVTMVLRNQSREVAYPVVRPGDGSTVGWREPYVYFTATVDTGDGVARPVGERPYGRCGFYNDHWRKDATVLKPGDELPLKDWLAEPSQMLDFQEGGRVKLVAHYRYRAGAVTPGGVGSGQEEPIGEMAGVPAFEVVSKPVEFEVVQPFEVRLKVKGTLTANKWRKLSELFEVQLVNRSREAIEVAVPTVAGESTLGFQCEGTSGGPAMNVEKQKSAERDTMTLKPGQVVAVLGTGKFANGLDGTWAHYTPATIKVRACFQASAGRYAPVVCSNWAELKVLDGEARR